MAGAAARPGWLEVGSTGVLVGTPLGILLGVPRVHLIRAVNVGGATLPMAELRDLATALGATDVATFIASGNLLCRPPGRPAEFDRALERAIEERYGWFREVISRSPTELRRALDTYPFEVVDPRFSHVYFLTGAPSAGAAEALAGLDLGADQVEVMGADLHIRYHAGVHQTKLTTAVIARVLGVQGTGRNLQTVRKLTALAEAS